MTVFLPMGWDHYQYTPVWNNSWKWKQIENIEHYLILFSSFKLCKPVNSITIYWFFSFPVHCAPQCIIYLCTYPFILSLYILSLARSKNTKANQYIHLFSLLLLLLLLHYVLALIYTSALVFVTTQPSYSILNFFPPNFQLFSLNLPLLTASFSISILMTFPSNVLPSNSWVVLQFLTLVAVHLSNCRRLFFSCFLHCFFNFDSAMWQLYRQTEESNQSHTNCYLLTTTGLVNTVLWTRSRSQKHLGTIVIKSWDILVKECTI